MDRPDGSVTAAGEDRRPAVEAGLTAAEVAARVAAGQTNQAAAASSRSVGEIVARNTFTWLNLIFLILGAGALSTGSFPDATFLIIAVINTVAGATQELRAKRTLDALAVINAPRVRVVRDGRPASIAVEDLVIDDAMQLAPGDQVVADAVVTGGRAEVNEALVTGESDAVAKGLADALLSGTWVVSGALSAKVVAVGAESYAGRLAAEARRYSLTSSFLMAGINRILRWLALAMAVVGPVLIVRQLQVQTWRAAVRSAVAALVGMIPEGLVLLTTLAFLTAAVRLGARRVLVQELPAVEGLARIDTLCTDKTGTLTEGSVEWGGVILPPGGDGSESPDSDQVRAALAALAGSQPVNATMSAIGAAVGAAPPWVARDTVDFSSERKWSGATFSQWGTWVLGAPEMISGEDPASLRATAQDLAGRGERTLVLAHGAQPLVDQMLPPDLRLVAVVRLRERLRGDAADTLSYFGRQGVTVRVVSGDSPATTSAVATQVGLPGADRPLDARAWQSDPERFADDVENHTVLGRVKPDQKREIVDALRRKGHVVAMTGDGVNDTLALKHADLGIAMGSGSAVAQGVAQLVLLDNQFSTLPTVVAEGRRVLHNIETVAVLFLVKNFYSIVISASVAVAGWPYPFLPRHLTLISGLAIGIPGFFLALGPSQERFRAGFVRRVITFSAIAGVATAVAVLLSYATARDESITPDQARTTAVMVTIVVSLWVLVLASRPLNKWKVALVAGVAGAFAASFVTPGVNTFFSVDHWPTVEVALQGVGFGVAACLAITAAVAVLKRRADGRLATML